MAGASSGVRGNEQSDVSGLPVSSVATDSERESTAEEPSEETDGEVVNNSGTEEVSAETKDVEVNVTINVNDEKEKEVVDDAETSVSE